MHRFSDEWQAFKETHRAIQPFLARGDTRELAYKRGVRELLREEKEKELANLAWSE